MNRRTFLQAAGTGLVTASVTTAATTAAASPRQRAPFRLKYAPHFGMFANHASALVDQLQFAADQGFTAWEDNGMPGRDEATQRQLAAKMQQLGMTMGVFVASADFGKATFAAGDAGHRERVLAEIEAACDLAARIDARWCTVVPGTFDHRLDPGFQTANVIDLLRRCCDVIARKQSDLVMVLEPLNRRDHPGLFLTGIPQAFAICTAVDNPHCKILDDLYHQQISEGNLIPNLDRAFAHIAYFQVGDNPGRNEPGTGEINYRRVFEHLHGKGYDGVVGMEHGNARPGKEGELALIAAYRDADAW
ncbi:MAG: TIM barrel protein [Planctomycetes bacterium]|nr:TIM barrel protein [Planctomycetota bacterium]